MNESADRPSQTDAGDVEATLARLGVTAPPSLAPATLVAAGLVDLYAEIETAIGPLFVAWNGVGVTSVGAAADPADFEERHGRQTGRPTRRQATLPGPLARAIGRRLSGDRRARIALDLRGRTEFEQAVWMKALEIPRGEVRPYAWVAAEIGRPRAVRAVGSALAHNPIPLVVPCHRVVRSDGLIGQYSLGGPHVKRALLTTEGLDPDELEWQARSGTRFVGSATTRIFCLPSCHNARRIRPQSRVSFRSLSETGAGGFRACRACRPLSGATMAA
jgi:O-6-methylguanine DNA methyltransferase